MLIKDAEFGRIDLIPLLEAAIRASCADEVADVDVDELMEGSG